MPSKKTKALLTTLISALFFSVMAIFVKIVATRISGMEILFVRAIFSLAIMGLIMYWNKWTKVRNIKMLSVRAIAGGIAVAFYFTAIQRIPLSAAVLLGNSYPIFAVLFSSIFIKEKPKYDSLMVLMIAFVGMFLILDPKFGQIDVGYIFGLMSAIFGGLAVTAIKVLRRTDSSWAIAYAQMVGAVLVVGVFMPASFVMPNINEWGFLLIIAICGIAAQVFFTRPFKFVPTAEGTFVAPMYAALTVLLSVIFLGEVLSGRFVLGASLVFGGMIYLILREEIKIKKNIL
ncbi:MAG: DMT family transporter [bacterium]